MQSVVRKCSHCGAPLPQFDPNATQVICSFCKVTNNLLPPPPPVLATPLASPPRASSPAIPIVLLAGVVFVALTALVGALLFLRAPSKPPSRSTTGPTKPASPIVPSKPEGYTIPMGPDSVMWMDQYASPVAIDANSDGIEDIVGPFIIADGANLNAHVGVFDGRDMHIIWKAGPFSTREKGTRKTGVAVTQGRVVAVEARGFAHLYELKDGREIATFEVDIDDIRALCAPPNGEPTIYVGQSWKPGVLIDVRAGVAKPGRAPEWCKGRERRPFDSGDVHSIRAQSGTGPSIGRMEWKNVLINGGDGVGIGSLKGEDSIHLVGFDGKSNAIRWQTTFAALIADWNDKMEPGALDLVDGRFYFMFGGRESARLVSLDARTGKIQWNVASPGSRAFNHTIGQQRVYVVTLEWQPLPVNVFDIRTGTLLARLGGATSKN